MWRWLRRMWWACGVVLLTAGPSAGQVVAAGGLTTDTDGATVVTGQATGLTINLSRYFDGTNWVRWDRSVTQAGTWTVQPGNTANTTAWLLKLSQTTTDNDVDVLTLPALPTGANTIGALVANQSVNQTQIAGVAIVAGRCQRKEATAVTINQTANAQLIAGVAAERIYICSAHLVTASTQNVALVSGTGATCGTGTAGMTGFGGATAATGWNFGANGGLVLPPSSQSWGQTAVNADNVCLLQSGAGQLSGGLTYVSLAP